MAITLQKRIGYLWLLLAIVNLINSLYQIIRGWGTWGILGNGNVFVRPYFDLIFPQLLFKRIFLESNEAYAEFRTLQLGYFIIFSLLSVVIPIFLIFNVKYSRVIAKVFLILLIILNAFAIFVKTTQFLPVRDKFSEYEIFNNKYVMNHIYYFSIVSLIAILIYVGLFYCKIKKEEV